MTISEELQNQEKSVAFLDVLGFKDIVRRKGARLDKYFETIDGILNSLEFGTIESQLISDSTILSCPFNRENFCLLLSTIQNIQVQCCLQNIWIRGAISLGDIYLNRSRNIVVGNGLTNAYLLEQEEKCPRVIIDPIIVQKLTGARLSFFQSVNYDKDNFKIPKAVPLVHQAPIGFFSPPLIEDDALFVSFAERIAIENGEDGMSTIAKNIGDQLYQGMANYQKYMWLKRYFAEALQGLMVQENAAVPNTFFRKWYDVFRLL